MHHETEFIIEQLTDDEEQIVKRARISESSESSDEETENVIIVIIIDILSLLSSTKLLVFRIWLKKTWPKR